MSWDAPTGAAPTDYRVNWARSGEDYPPWTDNTANHQPTTTSQQLTDLDEGVEYKVRVRARYHDGPWSGPWAEATRQVAAQPSPGVRSDDPPVTLEPPKLTVIEPATEDLGGRLDPGHVAVTGSDANPTLAARRFSPLSSSVGSAALRDCERSTHALSLRVAHALLRQRTPGAQRCVSTASSS